MTALILGANGYIGLAAATAFKSVGYKVFGTVRDAKSVRALEAQGVRALVVADLGEVSQYAEQLRSASVVVDCTADYANPQRIPRAVLEHLEAHPVAGDRQLYVYCSGILTRGATAPGEVADERTPHTGPGMPWRDAVEALVLDEGGRHRVARTILRPGFVYGGSGGSFGPKWFEETTIEGNPDRKLGWVHTDDLGRAFVAAERAPRSAVDGEAFFVTEENTPTWRDARNAFHRAAKGKDAAPLAAREARPDEGWYDFTVNVTSRKATRILGWHAHHSILASAETAWIEYKGSK